MPLARLLKGTPVVLGIALGLVTGLAWVGAALSSPGASPAPRGLAQGGGPALVGQFLVATETLRAPAFARTVIYMVRDDANGAMGLVVNRPVRDVPVASLLRQFGLDDRGVTGSVRAHYGGPVERGLGFMLHTGEYATQGTERIAGDIALTPSSSTTTTRASGTAPPPAAAATSSRGAGLEKRHCRNSRPDPD
jgi:putative transcriptional regulator